MARVILGSENILCELANVLEERTRRGTRARVRYCNCGRSFDDGTCNRSRAFDESAAIFFVLRDGL